MAFTENERNTLQLTGIGHLSCHFAMLLYPTIAIALSREEGFPLGEVIGWSFWGYFLFGAGALPIGLLSDRISARWIVRTGVLGIGPALMLVALFPPGPFLAIPLAIVGVFASLYHPSGLSLISRTIRLRGTALGLNGMMGNIGIAMAPFLAESATNAWGWRGAYFAMGAIMLILGLTVAFHPIREPSRGSVTRDEHHHEPVQRFKLFLILLLAMTMGGLTYRAVSVAQPAYFAEKIDFISYGKATSLVYVVGTFGQYFGGRFADRYDLRILYLSFHGISLPFILGMAALAGLPLLAVAGSFLFFNLGMQPIENSLVARFTPDRWRSTGYGLKFTVTFSIGALAVQLVKSIMENYSISTVFLCVGVSVLTTFCCAGFLLFNSKGQSVRNN